MGSESVTELARSGDVVAVAIDETSWSIGNDAIEYALTWTAENGLRMGRFGLVDGPAWNGAAGGNVWAFTWNGQTVRSGGASQELLGAKTRSDERSVTLQIRHRVAGFLVVTVNVRCYRGLSVVEQWLEIEPERSGLCADVVPLRLDLEVPGPATLHTVSGVQQQGGWQADIGEYRSFRLETSLLGTERRESGLRSTWQETPWLAVSGAGGPGGFFAGLLYSGQWHLSAESDASNTGVVAEVAPAGLAVALPAGVRWESPVVFAGAYAGDLDSAAAAQHDYHRAVLSPVLPDDFPWVQANTWFSYLCDFDQDVLAREVAIAQELGVEIFYVDAGWWVGNPRHADNFASGLGNWRENRDKFPDGLRAFADLVRSHGMRFGIWVEPERVDLRTATTGTWKADWLVRQEGAYCGPEWPRDTETAWLCFGHPECQAWAEAWIGDLVESLDVAWLKWDSNFWAVCTAPDHGHGAGDGEAAQLAGVHRVMDALRGRFPDLIIENCAGGGTRMDFEMARHTHVAWVNDASQPAHRVSFHLEGASYLFPPAVLNSWVAESNHENLKGRDLPQPVLTAIVRSRMMGALGFSCRTVEWSTETRQVVTAAIAEYKSFRHLLKDGYVSHLLPQATLVSPKLKTPAVWEAIQFRSRDAAEAVVLAFRNMSSAETIVLRPRGLDPDATYDVTGDDGETWRMAGAELASDGLRPKLMPLTSALYRVRRVEGGAA